MIDDYVRGLIAHFGKELEIRVDPEEKESRLELALALDRQGNSWEAMEIVVGRRINSQEQVYAVLHQHYRRVPQDPRKFYEGLEEAGTSPGRLQCVYSHDIKKE